MTKNNIFLTFVLAILLTNCASFEAQYKEKDETVVALPNKPIDKTFYLVGDAGKSPEGGMSKGLTAFKNHTANKNTTEDFVLFLGDNIYPDGLPSKDDPYYDEAKNHLQAQVNSVAGFKGEVLFIPGNHDWYADGLNGLKDEEKFIED